MPEPVNVTLTDCLFAEAGMYIRELAIGPRRFTYDPPVLASAGEGVWVNVRTGELKITTPPRLFKPAI